MHSGSCQVAGAAGFLCACVCVCVCMYVGLLQSLEIHKVIEEFQAKE